MLSDAKGVAEVVKRVSPDSLVCYRLTNPYAPALTIRQTVLDGVCSVASEEIQMDAWGIDVVLTASQKGLGTPPGLSIVVASQKAVKVRPRSSTFPDEMLIARRSSRRGRAP